MRDARADGETAEPNALLGALGAIENPLLVLADFDQLNALFELLYGEYGFLRLLGQPMPLSPEQRSRWVALLRWVIRELRAWRASTDPIYSKLASIFIVAQASDTGNVFWREVPAEVGSNAELVRHLRALLQTFKTSFVARGPAPIWEREAVEAFQAADLAGDWVEIGSRLREFEDQLIPSSIIVQSARCLYRCGTSHLADATANLRETIIAMQIASALSADERLSLALTSSNRYIEFAGVYQTISNRFAAEQISPADEQMLSRVLLKVARDEPRWRAWMELFNTYPVRYPSLQEPLGVTLAEAPEAAIDAYVDSIFLSVNPVRPVMPNRNRECIASCMRRFRASAAPDRRASLWSKAHHRWSIWNFDQANSQNHLLSLGRSDLDYALVGFAAECMNDGDMEQVKKNLIADLQTLENDWYVSSMDVISRFHRILSKFQPYAHAASALLSGEDWLTDAKIYYPFDPCVNKYFVMKYRLELAG
jgi:hypothetical protein